MINAPAPGTRGREEQDGEKSLAGWYGSSLARPSAAVNDALIGLLVARHNG